MKDVLYTAQMEIDRYLQMTLSSLYLSFFSFLWFAITLKIHFKFLIVFQEDFDLHWRKYVPIIIEQFWPEKQ